jgi:hypothetical protein
MGPDFAKPLTEHQQALDLVERQLAHVGKQMESIGTQLEAAVTAWRPGGDAQAELLSKLAELVVETREVTSQVRTLVARGGDGPADVSKPGMLSWLKGRR